MSAFSYEHSPYPVRQDLQQVYRDYWSMLSHPGNWWSGTERVAIANEVRQATSCEYCAQRKQALSPYNFAGQHTHAGELDELTVDAVHRIITDQARITQDWVDSLEQTGMRPEKYVELLGIAVTVFSIDEFNRGLGLTPEPLPPAHPGEPNHYRPAQAIRGTGFVPMLPTQGATGQEADLWGDHTANVLRALSVVPDAVRGWFMVAAGQYLDMAGMMQFSGDHGRAINRMQMELVAGRVSAINECFY
ncbi:hypothetical protein EYC98_05190 [Halieaceae bacterium IMCC14734]|uniref:Carboxymuconolactone decarboxylase-like domain-containing protein n=3 Tax=Candidatus Litorirhabdus singularis TaxID=2518993 RepID=A0ABT3TD89_9GAMM|nr:hypothetical protein [Candidatus Litorirhabdus singularis]